MPWAAALAAACGFCRRVGEGTRSADGLGGFGGEARLLGIDDGLGAPKRARACWAAQRGRWASREARPHLIARRVVGGG